MSELLLQDLQTKAVLAYELLHVEEGVGELPRYAGGAAQYLIY